MYLYGVYKIHSFFLLNVNLLLYLRSKTVIITSNNRERKAVSYPCEVVIPHPRIQFQTCAQVGENVGQSRKALFYLNVNFSCLEFQTTRNCL